MAGRAPDSHSATELTQDQLAKRLGVDSGSVTRAKAGEREDPFEEWSRKKDPQGVGWQWNGQKGKASRFIRVPQK